MMRSHSGSYTAFLPWRHVFTLQASYSDIESVMPLPFTQGGTSWQVGARYEIPLELKRKVAERLKPYIDRYGYRAAVDAALAKPSAPVRETEPS